MESTAATSSYSTLTARAPACAARRFVPKHTAITWPTQVMDGFGPLSVANTSSSLITAPMWLVPCTSSAVTTSTTRPPPSSEQLASSFPPLRARAGVGSSLRSQACGTVLRTSAACRQPGGSGMSSTYSATPETCFSEAMCLTGSPTGALFDGLLWPPCPPTVLSMADGESASWVPGSPAVSPPLSPAGNVCDPWLSGLGDVTKFWAADASLGATSGGGGSVLWDETRPGAARVADKSWHVWTKNLKKKEGGRARRYSGWPPGTVSGSGMSSPRPLKTSRKPAASKGFPSSAARALAQKTVVGPIPPKARPAEATSQAAPLDPPGLSRRAIPPVTMLISSSRRRACLYGCTKKKGEFGSGMEMLRMTSPASRATFR
mmetsp:Transcript_9905/g.22739  ORF Transcript_9905/g.22739 Transcript_9905/m.22739 type:complete len:376 (-) Transcript_9905:448-1575(-)